MIVKFGMFKPKTLPTNRPHSFPKEANVDTESLGKEVDIESSINPAVISESPRIFDRKNVYLIILSLTGLMRNFEIARRGTHNKITFHPSRM
jgi:hypothetical protein